MSKGEKRPIPGTNPAWNRNLPPGFDNSLVDDNGNPYDDGYNFEEPSEDNEDEEMSEDENTGWDELAEKPEKE